MRILLMLILFCVGALNVGVSVGFQETELQEDENWDFDLERNNVREDYPLDVSFAAPREYVVAVLRQDLRNQLDIEINMMKSLFQLDDSKLDLLKSGRDSAVERFTENWADENKGLFVSEDHKFCEVDMEKVDLQNIDLSKVLPRIFDLMPGGSYGGPENVKNDDAWVRTVSSVLTEEESAAFKETKNAQKISRQEAFVSLLCQIYGRKMGIDDEQAQQLLAFFSDSDSVSNAKTIGACEFVPQWYDAYSVSFASVLDKDDQGLERFLSKKQLERWWVFYKKYQRMILLHLEYNELDDSDALDFWSDDTPSRKYVTEVARLEAMQQLDLEIESIQSLISLDDEGVQKLQAVQKQIAQKHAEEWNAVGFQRWAGFLNDGGDEIEAAEINLKDVHHNVFEKIYSDLDGATYFRRAADDPLWLSTIEALLNETDMATYNEAKRVSQEKIQDALTEVFFQTFAGEIFITPDQQDDFRALIKMALSSAKEFLGTADCMVERTVILASIEQGVLSQILSTEQLGRWNALLGSYRDANRVKWSQVDGEWKMIEK